jgi:hypothetical protein
MLEHVFSAVDIVSGRWKTSGRCLAWNLVPDYQKKNETIKQKECKKMILKAKKTCSSTSFQLLMM